MLKNLFFSNYLIVRTPLCHLKKEIPEDIFTEALYLSSPDLCNEYCKLRDNKLVDKKEIKKLNISLYKYQSRASTRCTPFGLFAGLSICKWENENNIILEENLKTTLNRKTRLDMNVLCSLAQELSKKEYVKPFLKFYPNTSIYLIGDTYRYVEYYYSNNRRVHKINKVDFSEYLQLILKESKIGLSRSQLLSLLISDDISKEEANDFINELIESQLLINQLEPTVTGDDYFELLTLNLCQINKSNQSEELTQLIQILNEVNICIKQIDDSIFNSIDSYKLIHQKLKNILFELKETNLFQTDLYKTFTCKSIDNAIQYQLRNTIHFLNKISPLSPNKNLEEFKKKFIERYGDNEISLLIALDTETGIGYPSSDVNGVNELIEDVYAMATITSDSEIKWNLLQAHLLKLITECNKQRKKIIEISEADFKGIDFSEGSLPTTFSVMFKVLNTKSNKIEMSGIGGSSAINLLGRFAGGNEELRGLVNTIADFEQQQNLDKILAEIVHLPESRTGNILARPSFRPYEIPYLAKSTIDDNFQIKMEDLTLKVKANKIILFDKRLQKEIIPRLGNAHSFGHNSLPVYHFLCDLQAQDFTKSYFGFNWGVLSNQFEFLPRVEFQNTVLSPAKWQISKQYLEPLKDKKISNLEKHNLFFELKNKLELPDKFLIADGDNELLIVCNSSIAVDTFIDSIKKRNEITLEEYLFEDEQALIKDNQGNSFTNECIAILFNENKTNEISNLIESKKNSSKQVFAIGSEWLYYKIYCGAKTADYILTEKIKKITEILFEKKIIDQWFFIRYADPDVHLRLRLHISNFEKYGDVLKLINEEFEPLLNQYIISKIQTDTYNRELDRYGDNSIDLVENLFFNDSIFVTNMLDMLDASIGGTIRWKMGLRSVDAFLNDFKLNAEEKFNLVSKLNTSFFIEHGGRKELKLILDAKFRKLRTELEYVLDSSNEKSKEYYPIIELINIRSESNKKIIEKIFLLNSNQELQISLNDLLASLLHMNLDRLFMGRNRTNEFVIYDLLTRYYKSNLARLKGLTKKESLLNNQ